MGARALQHKGKGSDRCCILGGKDMQLAQSRARSDPLAALDATILREGVLLVNAGHFSPHW
jgi:hypothetical protein